MPRKGDSLPRVSQQVLVLSLAGIGVNNATVSVAVLITRMLTIAFGVGGGVIGALLLARRLTQPPFGSD